MRWRSQVDGDVHHVPDGVVARADQVADEPLGCRLRHRRAAVAAARQMPVCLESSSTNIASDHGVGKDAALDRDHLRAGRDRRAGGSRSPARRRRDRAAMRMARSRSRYPQRGRPIAARELGIGRAAIVGQDGGERIRTGGRERFGGRGPRQRAELADGGAVEQVQRRAGLGAPSTPPARSSSA